LLSHGFDDNYTPTVRADLHIARIKVDKVRFNVEICDISGNQKDILETKVFFRGSALALIVYDICEQASLDNVEYWLKVLAENQPDPNLIIAVIGNKCDLANDRKVEYDTVKSLADENKVIYFETSAKEPKTLEHCTKIRDLLKILLRDYLKVMPEEQNSSDSFDSQDENQDPIYQENMAKFQEQMLNKFLGPSNIL